MIAIRMKKKKDIFLFLKFFESRSIRFLSISFSGSDNLDNEWVSFLNYLHIERWKKKYRSKLFNIFRTIDFNACVTRKASNEWTL